MSKLKREKTTATLLIAIFMISTLAVIIPALANTEGSSTMHFDGPLTDQGKGVYIGTIDMTAGEYYVVDGPGEGIYDQGGFDVYAKAGETAFWEGKDPFIVPNDHDAYNEGGPWGTWYDPDCSDWYQYELELTEDHWYLRYASTGESPMSGTLKWRGDGTGYAAETDPGTVRTDVGDENRDATRYAAGSAQEWGWDCGWGEERIPLEYPGFEVLVTGGSSYQVTLTPAPERGPQGFYLEYYQTQFQWRGNKGAFGSWTSYHYGWSHSHCSLTGKALHSYFEYSPLVEELTGASTVYVSHKKSGDWVLNEGEITYKYPDGYGIYTVVNYFRGYMEFSDTPSPSTFTEGGLYQWVYLFAEESEEEQILEHIDYPIWDPVMEAWLIGFSIYWQDQTPTEHTQSFPGPIGIFPRPVPAKNYDPLNLYP